MRLFTYLPKENTVDIDGILSTSMTEHGFEKYRGRTGKWTKEDVLKVLDSWESDWQRSKGISALTEPIPHDAAKRFRDFAKSHRLYSFDTNALAKLKILEHIRLARTKKGGGTDEVPYTIRHDIDWNGNPGSYLFSGIPHYMIQTKDGKIPADVVREEKTISFPYYEIGQLKKQDRIFTTRVSDDFMKYNEGDIVSTPWGDRFVIRKRIVIPNLEQHPFYDKLTDSQRNEIGRHKDIAGLWLDRIVEKTASHKIDIRKLYDEIKRRYKEMGYEISGDRLIIDSQPRYTNGKPVPISAMKPNVSGGDAQDDGTIRINPNYRSVMRHWNLKGSGRDFINTIIGHELGHHIDRTLLRGTPGSQQDLRDSILDEIRRKRFHTVYTDSYDPETTDPRKLDKELIAEYLSHVVNEKKADDSRNRIVSENRHSAGLPVSGNGRKGRYAGGAFGGSAWDNGDGTTTVRKGNNELTVPSKAHQSAMRTVGPRNTSFLVPGALASGVVDSAADVAFIPQSFEPIVNAVSPSAAGAYSRFFDGISGVLRSAAGKIRAATDGNPHTITSDSGTWNKNDPAAGSGMNLQDVSKSVSLGPRAYLSWRYALKPLLRAGKWLSTGTSGSATAARMASGAGFARHGADMIEEGSPIAGAAVMAAGTLGMAGPMGSGRGVIQGLQKGVNRFASPVLERLSALSQRVPLVGRHIGTAIDSHIPTGLAVSPDPHVLTR